MTNCLLAPLGSPGVGQNFACPEDCSWNIRGLGDPRKKSTLRCQLGASKPHILLLLESHLSSPGVTNVWSCSCSFFWYLWWPFNASMLLFDNFISSPALLDLNSLGTIFLGLKILE
ncbi:hypothetical protein AMTRI_Chr06g195400 [Amborella trichopoda]